VRNYINHLYCLHEDLVELLEMHDQIYVLKEDDVYKLYIIKENVPELRVCASLCVVQ
jgi:uncharacterized protein Yka (UPF0111/DUF47 family)